MRERRLVSEAGIYGLSRNDGFVPNRANRMFVVMMNEWQELGSGDGGLNGRVWAKPATPLSGIKAVRADV